MGESVENGVSKDAGEERREKLRRWLDTPSPQDYDAALVELKEMHDLFLRECGSRFEGPLNSRLLSSDLFLYKAKLEFMRSAAHDLSDLSLAIQCPNSALPAVFVGGDYDGLRGRFQLRTVGPGAPRRISFTAVELCHLSLMPRPPRLIYGTGLGRK